MITDKVLSCEPSKLRNVRGVDFCHFHRASRQLFTARCMCGLCSFQRKDTSFEQRQIWRNDQVPEDKSKHCLFCSHLEVRNLVGLVHFSFRCLKTAEINKNNEFSELSYILGLLLLVCAIKLPLTHGNPKNK